MIRDTRGRSQVRESWAKDQLTLSGIRVVFLVGHLVNNSRQVILSREDEFANSELLYELVNLKVIFPIIMTRSAHQSNQRVS